MPYIYRVRRHEAASPLVVNPSKAGLVVTSPAAPEPVAPEPVAEFSYRDLQGQAKALDIPANQTADDLKKAISEANGDG